MKKICKYCDHFIGGGDWNLCCSVEHPTPEEKKKGLTFYFGHLCYEDTEACDMFKPQAIKCGWCFEGLCTYCRSLEKQYDDEIDGIPVDMCDGSALSMLTCGRAR